MLILLYIILEWSGTLVNDEANFTDQYTKHMSIPMKQWTF